MISESETIVTRFARQFCLIALFLAVITSTFSTQYITTEDGNWALATIPVDPRPLSARHIHPLIQHMRVSKHRHKRDVGGVAANADADDLIGLRHAGRVHQMP
ncbi:hypothetical protein BH09PSE3_BH09PSE3_24210 [soil metagenome]